MNHNKLYQQSEINESIQTYKASSLINTRSYPYEKEKALVTKLKTGDTATAKSLLNDLLGYVFFAEGSNLQIVKSRAMELSSLLSRAAIEGGATSDSVLRVNNQFLKDLQSIQSLDDLCYRLQENIDVFTECMFDYIPSRGNEIIKRAIRYISGNYSQNLTLEDLAEHASLSPSYLSRLFKKELSISISDYICETKIEKAQHLLKYSDYSMVDIANYLAFSSQSHFIQTFKKLIGVTPKKYRDHYYRTSW